MAWEQTKNIANLTRQFNERFPNRDKASDGTIGDTAHQAETSGHNPDDTPGSRPAWDGDADHKQEVRAKDLDSDLGEPGTVMQDVVDHLVKLPGFSKVCRYLIYNGRMYHSRDSYLATAYTGASAHREHLHYEGAWSDAADENDSYDFRLDEINMPTADEILDRLAARLKDDKDPLAAIMRATPWKYVGGGLQGAPSSLWALADSQSIKGMVGAVATAVAGIGDVDENALGKAVAANLLEPLRDAILSSLPEGSLTKEDVASVLDAEISKIRVNINPS